MVPRLELSSALGHLPGPSVLHLLVLSLYYLTIAYCTLFIMILNIYLLFREETEIIEGEVVEIQIDRPATGTVRQGFCYILFVRNVFRILMIARDVLTIVLGLKAKDASRTKKSNRSKTF